jgi:hypothetical protein
MGSDSGISSIIGDRLYLLRLPQGALGGPAISFSTTGDIPKHAHGMLSVCKDVDLTLNLWSTSTLNLESLKQAVITFWNAYDGALGSSYVSNALLNDIGYSFEDDTKLYHSVILVNLKLRN